MARNSKMVMCRNCNNPMSAEAKVCPSCGAKNKKPFYKKGWFIILAVVVVVGVIGSTVGGGGRGEKFQWDDMELSHMLPEPKSNVGEIISNSEEHLSIYLHKTSKDEYKAYLTECEAVGFTIESDKSENSYDAYNETGYKLSLWYDDGAEQLRINLDAPMEMGELQWPTSGLASLLPSPESRVGKILSDSSDRLFVYVGETSLEEYHAYVDECSAKGFSVDYDKGDNYYYADNANRYHISLRYEGNGIMSIEVDKPDGTTMPSEPEPESEEATELVDGMRPEFKTAMDSYEEFFDEYCAFMEKYNASGGNDLTLLADYATYMGKYADMMADFEAWDEEEMNTAETTYYIEVQTRINQKLLAVAE